MAVAIDLGTMHFVKASIDDVDDSGVSFEIERNVFAEVRETLENPEQILKENNYSYVKIKDKFYVIGNDVYKIHDIESLFKKSGSVSYFSEVRRPMKNGLLNTAEDKMSISIIQEIIKRLVGKPAQPNEILCFCAPGEPVNSKNNVLFHKMMLTNFLASLGYKVECVNEALAIIYSECPTMEAPDEASGVAKFSGISMSYGSGMTNCCLAYKQLPLLTFSVEHAGDWIDQEAARVAGSDIATITKYKEKNLNLDKIDQSDIKQLALEVYYKAMIENSLKHFAAKFEKLESNQKTTAPLEIVVAGGTASVPGFIGKFKEVLDTLDLPFAIKGVRLAKNPLYTVANGLLTKAIALENAQKKEK